MARIDWAVVCEHAFFDRQERLCLVGITRQLAFPSLPVGLHQLVVVARLADILPVDEIAVSVGVVTPSNGVVSPSMPEGLALQVIREYIVATLRDVPLSEEGNYRFQIELRGQRPASIDVSVLAHSDAAVEVH